MTATAERNVTISFKLPFNEYSFIYTSYPNITFLSCVIHIQLSRFDSTYKDRRHIYWASGNIPQVVHVSFLLSLSDGLVLPQLLKQLRLRLAVVRQCGSSCRCGGNQFRIQIVAKKPRRKRLQSVDEERPRLQASSTDGR